MAAYWVHQNREVFEQNFSHLGVSNGPGSLIDDESPWEYTFYATGRVNCNYAMTLFDLKKRQDLISAFLLSIIWPRKDKITIEVTLASICSSIPLRLDSYQYKPSNSNGTCCCQKGHGEKSPIKKL